MPDTNLSKMVVFRLLRDRVGGKARVRDEFFSHDLKKSLVAELPEMVFANPTDIELLREAIRSSSSQLRQHRSSISNH